MARVFRVKALPKTIKKSAIRETKIPTSNWKWWLLNLTPMPRVKIGPEDIIAYQFFTTIKNMIHEGKLNCQIFHIANEFGGTHRPVFGAKMKALGVIGGAPDYIIQCKGHALQIEIKTPTGRLQDNQKAWQAWSEHAGNSYHVARSKDEAVQLVLEFCDTNDKPL